MITSNRVYRITGALLLALALITILVLAGVQRGAVAAPAGAPAQQIPSAQMAPLTPANCTLDGVTLTRTCDLWALPGTMNLPGGTVVNMWGFAAEAAGPALVPGPVINAKAGETLVLTLHNEVPGQTISLGFPGQALVPDLVGVPSGSIQTYTLTNLTPGTFLYEAGMTADGARQVAMGLFGALIVADTAPPAWNQEIVLLFSEIDPAFNADPTTFSLIKFQPKYWLINGKAFPDTGWIEVSPGSTLLMRYLNAGVETHSIGLLGLNQQVLAVDGQPLPFSHGATALALAAGETKEAVVSVPAGAEANTAFPIYHGSLHQHNNNQRLSDMRAAFGGMLAFLQVGGTPPAAGPVASNVTVTPQKTDGSVDVILAATLTDADANVVAFEYFVDGGTATTENVITPAATVDVSAVFAAADVVTWADGNYTLSIRGQDADGNWGEPGSAVLTVDKTGPVISETAVEPSLTNGQVDVAVSANANDSSNVTAAEYRVDAGGWLPMTLDPAGAPSTSLAATIAATDVAGLAEGTHTVEVRAQDEVGNWSATYGATSLDVDQIAPAVSNLLLSPSSVDLGNLVPVNVTAQVDDSFSNIAGAEAFIDATGAPGTGYAMTATDGAFDTISEAVTVAIPAADLAGLATGEHLIFVVGTDAAGNASAAASAPLTITGTPPDTTGPTVTGLTASPNPTGKAKNVDLTATATDEASNVVAAFWYSNVDSTPTPMSAADGTFDSLTEALTAKFNINKWPAGTYQISVYAVDAAGNQGPATTIDLVVGN